MSKQRYILDADDILTPDLFTATNVANMVNGANDVVPGVGFGVSVGGTGNTTFTPGQTVVFDGEKLVSSGSGPIPTNPANYDDRYYTKSQIDAKFASLAAAGGFSVAYANLTGVPTPKVPVFLNTPIALFTSDLTGVISNAVPSQIPGTATMLILSVVCYNGHRGSAASTAAWTWKQSASVSTNIPMVSILSVDYNDYAFAGIYPISYDGTYTFTPTYYDGVVSASVSIIGYI